MPRHDPAVVPDAFVASSAVLEGDVRVDEERELLAAADFFGTVFAAAPADLVELHRRSAAAVAAEIRQRSR
jgi:carbonic anhydrase/acetyltransferase-like protein (isoleucine patch superfamily)